LFGDHQGRAFGLRPIGFPRVKAVHALVVDGIYVGNFLFEGLNIDEGDKNNSTRDLRGIEQVDELLKRDDGGVFGTVRTGDEREDRTTLLAVDDDDGNVNSGVDTIRNF